MTASHPANTVTGMTTRTCPTCGEGRFTLVAKFDTNRNPISERVCVACGHVDTYLDDSTTEDDALLALSILRKVMQGDDMYTDLRFGDELVLDGHVDGFTASECELIARLRRSDRNVVEQGA